MDLLLMMHGALTENISTAVSSPSHEEEQATDGFGSAVVLPDDALVLLQAFRHYFGLVSVHEKEKGWWTFESQTISGGLTMPLVLLRGKLPI
jgi:hypothetical protein